MSRSIHVRAPGSVPEIVLASASPRRRELLRAAGIPFEAAAADIPERQRRGETPVDFVRRLAVAKAEAIASKRQGEARPIVGADTAVVVAGRVLGKPESAAHAAEMLRLLSGRFHVVLTGVCVLQPQGRRRLRVVRTRVRFARLRESEIAEYVASGEPLDKAGAYAIQGRASRFVEEIDGCYFNVVGLPVPLLYRMLKQLGPHFARREKKTTKTGARASSRRRRPGATA